MLILILGSSLFILQNKAYLIKKAGLKEAKFDIDQILIKVLIRSNEYIEKQIRIMNTGNELTKIDVEALGLEDLVKIDSNSFALKPGQTKVVALNFSSYISEQKIEQQPGIYVGKLLVKSEDASKEIPIVVEIETKNVLFDMNLNPIAFERKVKQGSETTIEVRLFNLESIESTNVDVEYFVKDMNGNTILTESETVVVKTQASFFKTISIPKNLKPGSYTFAAISRFGNSIGTASYLFEVTGPEVEASFVQFCKNSILCLGVSLTTILLLFALMAYFYFFIGAYLYERITGVITIPRKRKEEMEEVVKEKAVEKPKVSVFDSIRRRMDTWNKARERKKLDRERIEREGALQILAEERKDLAAAKRKQFEEAKRKEEEIKQQEFLRKQNELERQRIEEESRKRAEELRKQKELEAKQKRRERRNLRLERRKKIREFFHKIRLYKTPEEKKQIALQKEKERQEKLRKEQQLKQQNELESQRIEEERKEKEEELRKQKELEIKQREEEEKHKQIEQGKEKALEKQKFEAEKKKELEERKRKKSERSKRLKVLFHKFGLFKTAEEKKQDLEKKVRHSKDLNKVYTVLDEANIAIDKKNITKVDKLYAEARDLYVNLANSEKQEVYNKLMNFYQKRNIVLEEEKRLKISKSREELKKQSGIEAEKKAEELRKSQEAEAKRKADELKKQKELGERKRQSSERRKKIREFFHKIGIFKTPEEKKQIALQKEKERQEKLRKKEQLRKQKEFERQRIEEERKEKEEELRKQKELEIKQREEEEKRQLEEEKRNQQEIKKKELERQKAEGESRKRSEELKKQKELEEKRREDERKKQLESKIKLEEERQIKEEQEKRHKDFEKKKQEILKVKKLGQIRQIESDLSSNKRLADQLNSKIKDLELEKKNLSSNINEISVNVQNIEHRILDKLKEIENLKLEKTTLQDHYKKRLEELAKEREDRKVAIDFELKNLTSKLAAKEAALLKEMSHELGKLGPELRKKTEKWKRLEIKAKLKVEEQKLLEELKKEEDKITNEIKGNAHNQKLQMDEITKRQLEMKQTIDGLENQRQNILLERTDIPKKVVRKEKEIEKIKKELEILMAEGEKFNAELDRLKSELKPKFDLFSVLIPRYKGESEEESRRIEEQKAKPISWKEKRKEEPRRQIEQQFKLRKLENITPEKRAGFFGKLLGKAESELEQVESDIRSLDSFEKSEKLEERQPKEEEKTAKTSDKIAGKSKKLEKFYIILGNSKESLNNNDLAKAKSLYIEARNHYVNLEYKDKKEAYDKLIELYNKLSKQ